MAVIYNEQTGEALRADEAGKWVPTKIIENPQTGEKMALDGAEWRALKMPERPLKLAEEGIASTGGFYKGAANMLGAPVDLLGAGLRAVGLGYQSPGATDVLRSQVTGQPLERKPVEFFGGSESIKRGMRGLGLNLDTEAQTLPGRLAARTAQELGGAAAGFGAGGAIQRAGQAGYAAIGPKLGAVLDAFVANPGAQAVASTGAGLGAGTAREVFPDSQLAETVGGLVGGAAGSLVAPVTRYAVDTAKDVLAPFAERGREQIVGRTLKRMSTDGDSLTTRLSDAVDDGLEIVPGSQPTTAQAIRDDGLAATERALRGADTRIAGQFSARAAANNAARLSSLESVAPGQGGAERVTGIVRGTVDAATDNADSLIAGAQQRAAQRIAELGPGMDSQAAGAVIREEYGSALAASRAAVSRAYQAIDPEGVARFDATPVYDATAPIVAQYYGKSTFGVPPDLQAVLERLRNSPSLGFEDVDGMVQDLGSIAGRAAMSGDNRLASVAGTMGDALRAHLDDVAAGNRAGANVGFTPEMAEQYGAARAARREQGTRFEQGAAARVGATRRFGEPTLTNAEVPAQFFNSTKGGADDAAKFIQALGDRPAAVAALEAHAVNDLAKYATRPDGTIDAKRLFNWQARHSGALEQFPELRARVQNATAAQQAVEELVGQRARTLDEFNKSAFQFFLKRNPDDAVAGILASSNSERQMADLVRRLGGNREALDGLRAAVKDRAIARAQVATENSLGDRSLGMRGFVDFMDANRKAMGHLFSEEQLQAWDRIGRDLSRASFSDSGAKIAGSNTMQNLSAANLIARLTGGIVDPNNTFIQTLARPAQWLYKLPEQQVRDLMANALLDPVLARQLAAKATPQSMANIGRLLRQKLATTTGMTTAQAMQDREPRGLEIELTDPGNRRTPNPGIQEGAR